MSESRLVRSSVVWIVAVPVAARIVKELRANVTEPGWARSAVESLHLPFSWQVLFLGALAFAVAVKVFDLFCPAIIRENESYGDFTAAGRGPIHLAAYQVAICGTQVEALRTPVEKEMVWKAGPVLLRMDKAGRDVSFFHDKGPMKPMYPSMETASDFPATGDCLSEQAAFWELWDHANGHGPKWIKAAAVAYGFGLICFGVVFVQNLWWVATVAFA